MLGTRKPGAVTEKHVRRALLALRDTRKRDPHRRDGEVPLYVDATGQPATLVATALEHVGIDTDILRSLDQELPVGEVRPRHGGVRISESRHPCLRLFSPQARLLLQYLQDRQRCRHEPWAVSIRAAFTLRLPLLRRWDRRSRPWLYTQVPAR